MHVQGQASEWALLRRHSSEDLFGVQICGAYPDTVTRTVELIDQECTVDFIDINMGCPIDIVVNKGAGSALLMKPMRMKSIVQATSATVNRPITIKVPNTIVIDVAHLNMFPFLILGLFVVCDLNFYCPCQKKKIKNSNVLSSLSLSNMFVGTVGTNSLF